MTIHRAFMALAALLVVACTQPTASSASPPQQQPAGWDDQLRMVEAKDANPDPNIFETTLVAQVANIEILPGRSTPVWTYNGVFPGPVIHVGQGQRLIVHLVNQLPEATTIHWHGIRLPNAMDGVPDVGQPAVAPGGSFDYDFTVPDAGTFWYHPHVRSAAQVGFGLYGAMLVTGREEPAELGDELIVLLSDMSINDDGSLTSPDAGGDFATLFGREGNVLLVNGKVNPVLRARAGARQRWRVINAAGARYYQVELAGQRFTRIGGDGGFLEHPEQVANILLPPAERADVVFDLALNHDSELPVRWVAYDRGYGSTFERRDETIFRIQTDATERLTPAALPTLNRTIEAIDVSHAVPQSLQLTWNNQGSKFALGINGVPGDEAKPIMAAMGDTQL